jgi:hypothetical protein
MHMVQGLQSRPKSFGPVQANPKMMGVDGFFRAYRIILVPAEASHICCAFDSLFAVVVACPRAVVGALEAIDG